MKPKITGLTGIEMREARQNVNEVAALINILALVKSHRCVLKFYIYPSVMSSSSPSLIIRSWATSQKALVKDAWIAHYIKTFLRAAWEGQEFVNAIASLFFTLLPGACLQLTSVLIRQCSGKVNTVWLKILPLMQQSVVISLKSQPDMLILQEGGLEEKRRANFPYLFL